jgi:hypothetical protein
MKPKLVAARICGALNEGGCRYLVVGGTAGILHATADLDLLVERSPANLLRLLAALARVGYGFAAGWPPEEIGRRPVTVLGDDPAVNLFTVLRGMGYDQAAPRSRILPVEGVRLPVLSLDDLIATKQTGRAVDMADVAALEAIRAALTRPAPAA